MTKKTTPYLHRYTFGIPNRIWPFVMVDEVFNLLTGSYGCFAGVNGSDTVLSI